MAGKNKRIEAQLSSKQMLQKKGGRVQTVPVHTDEELVEQLARVQADLAQEFRSGLKQFRNEVAKAESEARVAELRAKEKELKNAVRDTTVFIKFRSIGRHAYKQLLDQHLPREQDHQDARRAVGKPDDETVKAAWNNDTFPAALMVASCFDPGFESVEELLEITSEWNEGEWDRLFMGAHQANTQSRVVDLGES